jgi:hypothetical protein
MWGWIFRATTDTELRRETVLLSVFPISDGCQTRTQSCVLSVRTNQCGGVVETLIVLPVLLYFLHFHNVLKSGLITPNRNSR